MRTHQDMSFRRLVSAGFRLGLLFCLFSGPVHAQLPHSYPRLFVFHFYYAPPEWYAQFDVVRGRYNTYPKLKELNPDIFRWGSKDWNVWEGSGDAPAEWFARDTNGNKILLTNYGYLMDISDLCLTYQGQRYCDYLIDYTHDFMVANPNFDGFQSQGVWWYPGGNDNIDLDRNGANDWYEHGKDWLTNRWLAGVHVTAAGVYQDLSAMGKPLLLNSGTFHTFEWRNSNALCIEKQTSPVNITRFTDLYAEWMDTAPEPHIFQVDCRGPSKNSYRVMRYLLTLVLLGDAYFSFTDGFHEHRYHRYYDEYDTDLGWPTSQMVQLANGCWVRFFDNGVSIMNGSGGNVTITDADLVGQAAYDGPYYRFRGGQAPQFNNGEPFDSITLQSETQQWGNTGDGIILLKEPRDVVCDIIIDNSGIATSAGSQKAEIVGSWMSHDSKRNQAWTQGADPTAGQHDYTATSSGHGESYAVYRPTIGLAGNYEVFEWHGFLGTSVDLEYEATNVPYTITYAGGVTAIGTIDQSIGSGQWNSLGTYYFNEGTDNFVKITNATDRSVIADAFKFVFRGTERDTIPPGSPANLQGNVTERSVELVWSPPTEASDGDTANSYQIFRDFTPLASPRVPHYVDENLEESTAYSYHVYAVDNMGNRSLSSTQGTFTTLADQTPPTLVNVRGLSLQSIAVEFNEPVETNSAQNVHNYSIDGGITVIRADLQDDLKTVELTTSLHVIGNQYNVTVSGILDRAAVPNIIGAGVSMGYQGVSSSITITISADDVYDLYVNGSFLGSDGDWSVAQVYTVPSIPGKNVIAVKVTDLAGPAGLVAEIDFEGRHYVSDETWKISTSEETGWETTSFNDIMWNKATSHGIHGVALPWAQYRNVTYISTAGDVHWIWSPDNEADDVVYLRFSLGIEGDTTPPDPPTAVTVIKHDDSP